MTFLTYVIRSLIHYRRMHLAVALAAATATATLTGSLLVGDSIRATLRYAFDTRLGNASWVLSAQERFFTEGLSQRLKKDDIDTAPVLLVRGMVTRGDGAIRVNQLHVLGVDDRFFNMSLAEKTPTSLEHGKALVNAALADRLRTKEDQIQYCAHTRACTPVAPPPSSFLSLSQAYIPTSHICTQHNHIRIRIMA